MYVCDLHWGMGMKYYREVTSLFSGVDLCCESMRAHLGLNEVGWLACYVLAVALMYSWGVGYLRMVLNYEL